jgi:hypothetical protein
MAFVRRQPLWARYVVTFAIAGILFAALIIFVSHNQQPLTEAPASSNKAQAQATQRQDTELVEQQQAPHVVKLAKRMSATSAASSAVHAYMAREVSHGFIAGPVDGMATCQATGGSSARKRFRCHVTSGQKLTKLLYPFDAVVQPRAAKVTYCQVVTPPYPLTEIPLKAACT